MKKVRELMSRYLVGSSPNKQKPIGDGYINLLEEFGRLANPKTIADDFIFDRLSLNWAKLDRMYRGSWVVGLLVDSIAEDMTQYGVTLTGSLEPQDQKKLQNGFTSFGIWDSLTALLKKARLYGGAIAYIDVAGQDPSSPLDLDTVSKGSFQGLRVYERWFIRPSMEDLVTEGRDFGLPRFYDLLSPDAMSSGGWFPQEGEGRDEYNARFLADFVPSGIRLHHSRVIRSVGIELPYVQRQTELYWGESILERVQAEIFSFHRAYAAFTNLLSFMNIRVFKLEGLKEMLSSDQPRRALEKRMSIMNEYQTINNATILDIKDEFAMHIYPFSGLMDAIRTAAQPLSASEGIPLVRFFGEAPKGLNATGDSDHRLYGENIRRRQEMMRDSMFKLLKVMHCSILGEEPGTDFNFEYVPLIQESFKEKAEIAYGVTKTIALALENGLISSYIGTQELSDMAQKTEIFTNITTQYLREKEEEDKAPPFDEANFPVQEDVLRGTSPRDGSMNFKDFGNSEIAQDFKGERETLPHPSPWMKWKAAKN